MRRSTFRRRIARGVMAVVAGASVWALAACGAASEASSTPSVVVAHIRTAVTDPTYSDSAGALFAMADDGSAITRIDPARSSSPNPTWHQRVSPPMTGIAGHAVAVPGSNSNLYVAQPREGRVAVISDTSLHQIASLPGGSDPTSIAVNSGSHHLLALSKDHSTITPVDLLHHGRTLPAHPVPRSSDTEVDGSKRGRRIDFFVAGSHGVFHYKWRFGTIGMTGHLAVPVSVAAGDLTKTSRLYAAEQGTDRLLAIESGRGGEGLSIVASRHLSGQIQYLAADQGRVYAATGNALYVLRSRSFGGFPDGVLPMLTTIDFRSSLPAGSAKSAPISGLAVGENRVYLTLKDVPIVISIAKPAL